MITYYKTYMSAHYTPSEIDYKPVQASIPRYRYTRIPLNNITGTSATITPNATQLLEWKIGGSTVYNLGKSFIQYTLALPAQGALNNTWNWMDVFDLGQTVQLGTAGGLYLCDLQYANNYSRVSRRLNTKFQDYMAQDAMLDGLGPSNISITLNQQATPNPYQANNIYSLTIGSQTATSTDALLANTEPLYITSVGALNTAYNVERLFPLNAFKDTIVGMDKDLYFGVDFYLRVTAGPGTKMAWLSTNTGQPQTGAAACNANITVKNLYLYLAVEQNTEIIESIVSAFNNGSLKYQIPYTTVFRNTMAAAGTSLNYNIQLSRQYGKRLKKIMNIAMNGNEGAGSNVGYDMSNWHGTKITTYQTYLDSRPLQDSAITCTQPLYLSTNSAAPNDDWRENQKYCKGSVIQNMGEYQLTWFHTDSFVAKDVYNTTIPDENLDIGLPMDSVKIYMFQATTIGNDDNNTSGQHNGINMYTYATFVKDVTASPSGPLLD